MTTAGFREFVLDREDWFRGRLPESEESLHYAEQRLGVRLPESLRWLLSGFGYWHGTGVSDLEESVTDTLLARERLQLPPRYVILENYHDGGLILLDTGDETSIGECAVYAWIGAEDLGADWEPPASARFPSFGAYVAHRLPTQQSLIDPRWVRYNPADYPNAGTEQ